MTKEGYLNTETVKSNLESILKHKSIVIIIINIIAINILKKNNHKKKKNIINVEGLSKKKKFD